MPAKNVIKEYERNAYYHLYNRGVAKTAIFLDNQDYKTFLYYLKLYLSFPDKEAALTKIPPSRKLRNYAGQINLICYCLMPNHFHLLVFQKDPQTINFFMKSLGTKYSMYFNKKYKRVGSLFQGPYKAVEITSENQLLYLSKYIHRNPIGLTRREPVGYKYSSYTNYLGLINQVWVKPLDFIGKDYKSFVEEIDERDSFFTKNIILEDD